MGRYGQSLDLGKDLENEAAQEAARKAQENPPKPEEPKPEPAVAPAAEKSVAEEPISEEPDEPEEPPRPPDPGEEDVVEILSKHVPHAFVPKKRTYGWILVLLGMVLLAGFLWSHYSRDTAHAMVAMTPLPTEVPEITPQNVSTEDDFARLLAAGLQDTPASS